MSTYEPMSSEEAITHFDHMGCLKQVVPDLEGKPCLILCESSSISYMLRCMRDFENTDKYIVGGSGIDAVTTDGIPIKMRYK